jgi:tRNA nucleotidyltransferase (CCA-adding enzyme)
MSVIKHIKTLLPDTCWPDIWLVGGTVRDMLLGQPVQDIDLVAAIPPAQLEVLGFRPVSPASSTPIWFKYIPKIGKIEITVITEPQQLEQDLRRRDFAINAMAMDLSGRLIDLLGGQADLTDKQVRVCSDSSLQDDPIRIFRAFRFATDGWNLHASTLQQLCSRQWEQVFGSIPVERFSRELHKSLEKQYPNLLFQLMIKHQIGSTYLPELFQMPQVPAGPLQYHPEGDLLTHSLQVMQRVAVKTSDPLARFCGFFHDLGKLSTDPLFYPKHYGHDAAGFKPAQLLCDRLRLPSAWQKALAWNCRLHTKANNWSELRTSTKIKVATQAVKAGITEILPLVSSADKPDGSGMDGWETVLQVTAMTAVELGIDQESFSQMPIHKRAEHIHHKRIQMVREILKTP